MRRITKQHPKNAGEYRYLRSLTLEHNLKRLSNHVQRLERKLRGTRCLTISQLRNTRALRSGMSAASIAA